MSHCLIIGAGAFGAGAAVELAKRGHRVTVLDPGPLPHPDASSTDISKVVRMDYGADALYTELMEQALPLWRRYNQQWPEPLFHEHGFCVLSSQPLAPGTFAGDSHALLTARGHALERLDADAICRRFPMWKPGRYIDGYYNPRGGWAESSRVVAALIDEARALGATVREGARVERLLDSDAGVAGALLEGGDRVAADTVIVAAGAWTPALVPELAALMSVVGQPVVHLRPDDAALFTPPRAVPWAADIERSGWYGFGVNAGGVVKIANHGPGTAMDPHGPRPFPIDIEEKLRAFLRDSVPALAGAPAVTRRVCLYCDTRDGDFVIDHHPERPGLVVAAGGSGHGFKLTPILGALIADVVEGAPAAPRPRFAWRTSAARRSEGARYQG